MDEELQQNSITIVNEDISQDELNQMYKYVLYNSDIHGQVRGTWFNGGIDKTGTFKMQYVRELKGSDNVPILCWTTLIAGNGTYKITNIPLTDAEIKEYKKSNKYQIGGSLSYFDLF